MAFIIFRWFSAREGRNHRFYQASRTNSYASSGYTAWKAWHFKYWHSCSKQKRWLVSYLKFLFTKFYFLITEMFRLSCWKELKYPLINVSLNREEFAITFIHLYHNSRLCMFNVDGWNKRSLNSLVSSIKGQNSRKILQALFITWVQKPIYGGNFGVCKSYQTPPCCFD